VVKPKAGANKTSFDILRLAGDVFPKTTLGAVPTLKQVLRNLFSQIAFAKLEIHI
jgi:hypothetical protein